MTDQGMWAGMTVCEEHLGGDGEDCDGCKAEAKEVAKRLGLLHQSIQDRLAALGRQGIQMPDTVRHEIQIQVLYDILAQNPRQGAIMQGEVLNRMLNAVKNMQQQVKQPTLHVARGHVDLSSLRKG